MCVSQCNVALERWSNEYPRDLASRVVSCLHWGDEVRKVLISNK